MQKKRFLSTFENIIILIRLILLYYIPIIKRSLLLFENNTSHIAPNEKDAISYSQNQIRSF